MLYDYEKGYCSVSSDDYPLREVGRGRQKRRYNVIQRDGKQTIIHKNVTLNELIEISEEIIRQRGASAWRG